MTSVANPDELYVLATDVLDAAAQALRAVYPLPEGEVEGGPLDLMPQMVCVVPGPPVFDACCVGMLTAHVESVVPTYAFPQQAGATLPCVPPESAVTVVVTGARCTPTQGTGPAGGPGCAELDPVARAVGVDAWAAWAGVLALLQAWNEVHDREGVIVGLTPLPEAGGCVGWELRVTVTVDGCPTEGFVFPPSETLTHVRDSSQYLAAANISGAYTVQTDDGTLVCTGATVLTLPAVAVLDPDGIGGHEYTVVVGGFFGVTLEPVPGTNLADTTGQAVPSYSVPTAAVLRLLQTAAGWSVTYDSSLLGGAGGTADLFVGSVAPPEPADPTSSAWVRTVGDLRSFVDFRLMPDGPVVNETNGTGSEDPAPLLSFHDTGAPFQPCFVIDGAVQSDMRTPSTPLDPTPKTGFGLQIAPGASGRIQWQHGGVIVGNGEMIDYSPCNVALSDDDGNAYLMGVVLGTFDVGADTTDPGNPVSARMRLIRDDLAAPTTIASAALPAMPEKGDIYEFVWDGELVGLLNGVEIVSVTDTTHDIGTFTGIGMPLHVGSDVVDWNDGYYQRVEWLSLSGTTVNTGETGVHIWTDGAWRPVGHQAEHVTTPGEVTDVPVTLVADAGVTEPVWFQSAFDHDKRISGVMAGKIDVGGGVIVGVVGRASRMLGFDGAWSDVWVVVQTITLDGVVFAAQTVRFTATDPDHPTIGDTFAAATVNVQTGTGTENAHAVNLEQLNDALPTLSDLDPEELGVVDPGVGTEVARVDHVHPMPSAADVGAAATGHDHDGEYDALGAAEVQRWSQNLAWEAPPDASPFQITDAMGVISASEGGGNPLVLPPNASGPQNGQTFVIVGISSATITADLPMRDSEWTVVADYTIADGVVFITYVNGSWVVVYDSTAGGGGGVPTSRTITAGTGLSGGGDLSADRTLAAVYGLADSTAVEGIALPHAFWRSGSYYNSSAPTLVNLGQTVASGQCKAMPFWNPVPSRTIDQLAVDVQAGSAGSGILYVCEDDGTGYPADVLVSGTMSTPTSSTRSTASASLTLPRGLLWLVAHGTGTTWSGLSLAGQSPLMPAPAAYATGSINCWNVTGAGTGTLSAFPAGASPTSTGVQVLVRAA